MTLDFAEALSYDTTNHRHHHDHCLDMTLDVAEQTKPLTESEIRVVKLLRKTSQGISFNVMKDDQISLPPEMIVSSVQSIRP